MQAFSVLGFTYNVRGAVLGPSERHRVLQMLQSLSTRNQSMQAQAASHWCALGTSAIATEELGLAYPSVRQPKQFVNPEDT